MHVVILGGTSGIGLAIATRLTAAGVSTTVTGRDAARLAAVKADVGAAEQLDATVDADVRAFFDRLGPIDHLVLAFSPGATALGPLATLDPAQIRTALDGKLLAYLLAARQAQVTGSIIMISAASARGAMPGTTVLAAVNGAIERLVPPLAAELAPVRVNAISPGVVDTPWWNFLGDVDRQAQFAELARTVPLERIGRPDDVAAAAEYLIKADYVTGVVLPVDGGLTMAR